MFYETSRERQMCFVVQHYGLEVNGGAELHCMQLAEHMFYIYPNIDVLQLNL